MGLRQSLLPLVLLVLLTSCQSPSRSPGIEQMISLPPGSRGVSWGDPIWSPDGETFAFNAFDAGTGFMTIYTFDLSSRSKHTFHEPSDYAIAGWSAEDKILLSSPGALSVTTAGNGSEVKKLTHGLGGALSPSGDKIAVFYGSSSRPMPVMKYGIRIFDIDSGESSSLYSFESSQVNPIDGMAWSPDETTLAFSTRGDNGRGNLYLISTDTKKIRQLTKGHDDLAPAWSPDGRHIAFVRNSGLILQSSSIVISNLAGEECWSIPVEAFTSAVSWSPNGKYLAYSTGTGIFLVDLASTEFNSKCLAE